MTGLVLDTNRKTLSNQQLQQHQQPLPHHTEFEFIQNPRRKNVTFNHCSLLSTLLVIFILVLLVGAFVDFRNNLTEDDYWSPQEDCKNCPYNDRPLIGILAQEYYGGTKPPTPANKSYIAASYVKFIEGAGARVVPIMINQNQSYYEKIFSSVNGVLFPGGAVDFNNSGYGEAGRILFDLAKSANDRGDYFPIWGTCLGFEFLVYTAIGNRDVLGYCDEQNVTKNLIFTKDAMTSNLFRRAEKSIIKLLQTKNLTANFHNRCLTNKVLKKYSLEEQLRVLSWSFDSTQQVKYVSSFEYLKYPFFGVQFHPEKNIYEWTTKEDIPHSFDATKIGQYFANFFVQSARRNNHSFVSEIEENSYLVYNYEPEFSGANGSAFVQRYFFDL